MYKLTLLLFFLISGLLGCYSNANKKEKEMLELKEKELNQREKMLEQAANGIDTSSKPMKDEDYTITQPVIKYVYVKILTLEPVTETDTYTGKYTTKWQSHIHSSNISEVNNLTEDKKAQLMDGFVISVKEGMKWTINNEGESVGKITDRKCLVFDSYSAASEDRFKNGNKY